jgi:hypothetical protein
VSGSFNQEHQEIIGRIKQAPVAIQFYPERLLGQLIQDSYYRNAFEVGTSTGSSSLKQRKVWEDALFSQSYEKAAPVERVKYGFLHGFAPVRLTYGDSLLLLKEEIKERCTLTIGDSSGADCVPYGANDPAPSFKMPSAATARVLGSSPGVMIPTWKYRSMAQYVWVKTWNAWYSTRSTVTTSRS